MNSSIPLPGVSKDLCTQGVEVNTVCSVADETKAAKMRLCKLEAAAIEALQLKLYSRAADAFEAVATEVVQDNLTAANATRLFFKSALCSLVGGEHDLMRGKVEIFAKRDPVFGASPEKLFLVDANRCATAGKSVAPAWRMQPAHSTPSAKQCSRTRLPSCRWS